MSLAILIIIGIQTIKIWDSKSVLEIIFKINSMIDKLNEVI